MPPRSGGKVVAPATKGGMHFRRPPGRLYGFRRQRRHKKAPERALTSPAQRYYITPEGGSPQPVREASAGPGQNPWRPGPKARRRHQPSRRSRVNLRKYWKAPHKSRPRRRHHRLSSPILRGDFSTPLRSGRNDDGPATLGPGPDPDRPKGACP